jgi:integrase
MMWDEMWDANMKRRGQHPQKILTPTRIRALSGAGRYADGNGLYLVVDPSGAKRWVLRTVIQGRRRDMGLGGLSSVSLADAREKAASYRRLARDGGDPVAERRNVKRVVPTFREAALSVHANHAEVWKNAKHGQQWINTLSTYAFPLLGERRVDQIETPDVLRVLAPIWLKKPETARRVMQRVRSVFDWAKVAGFRSGDNPVEWVVRGLPKQPDRSGHHAALPYAEVPAFVRALRAADVGEATQLAFEFLVLTAARTNEVLGAKWNEISFDECAWTIPGVRMKGGREHRIPLTPRCVEILRRAKELCGPSEFVFPGRSGNKPLSNMVFLMVLRRMKFDITAHGFRSAFRDWAAERTNFPREVCEMALAHVIKNKVEAAYRRGDLLEKRRDLMATWAAFATNDSGTVVSLRAAG